jgi:hypothetical protein
MSGGTWRTQTINGQNYNVLFQDEEADCGLCCCAMIVNLLGQGKPNSTIMQSNLPVGAYSKSTRDRANFQPTIFHQVAPSAHSEYHSAGTYIQSLGHVLNTFGILNTTHSNDGTDRRAALRTASETNPMIILVNWLAGGGHWIVIMGAQHRRKGLFSFFAGYTRLSVLDPYYGATTSDGTNSTYISRTRDGSYGSGSFAPYWLQVD